MKKFLFVSNRYDSSPAGGTALCHAHYEILCRIPELGSGQIISTINRTQEAESEPGKIVIKCARTYFDALVNTFTGKAASFLMPCTA